MDHVRSGCRSVRHRCGDCIAFCDSYHASRHCSGRIVQSQNPGRLIPAKRTAGYTNTGSFREVIPSRRRVRYRQRSACRNLCRLRIRRTVDSGNRQRVHNPVTRNRHSNVAGCAHQVEIIAGNVLDCRRIGDRQSAVPFVIGCRNHIHPHTAARLDSDA